MHLPGLPSLLLLAFLLVLLPLSGVRSGRALAAAGREGGDALPGSRSAIWTGTLFVQAVLLLMAWAVGRGFGFAILAVPPLGAADLLAALAALALMQGLGWLSRAIRSEEERRRMVVFRLAPRTSREWLLWIAVVLLASVGEEAAYRGVGMAVLTWALGEPWLPVLILSVAFALAHATQGARSAAVVFGMALVMHGLVALTDTLVLAMVVHATYDLLAGVRIARQVRADEQGAAAGAGT